MPRPGLNTQLVVASGAELADKVGFDRLTLARLADRLSIRSPSLYAHVDGLPDLQRRIGELGAERLGRELASAAAGRSGEEALGAIADAYRAFAADHPGVYAAVERAPTLGVGAEAARKPVDAVLAALRGYGLEGDDAIHAVRIVRAALHGFVALEASGGFGLKLDLDETFARLVATLHRGLAASGPIPVGRPT